MSLFRHKRGPISIVWKEKKASTAMTAGHMLAYSAAGLVTPATATSTEIIGLALRTITSADSDYASNTLIPILVGDETTVFEASGEAHSCTQAMNGEFVDITDSNTINGGANSLEVIKVERYIDSTTVEISFAKKSGVAASTNAD